MIRSKHKGFDIEIYKTNDRWHCMVWGEDGLFYWEVYIKTANKALKNAISYIDGNYKEE